MNFDTLEEREEREEVDGKRMEVKDTPSQKVTTMETTSTVSEIETSPLDENAEWAQVGNSHRIELYIN